MYLHMLPNHKQARKVIWDGFTNEGVPIIEAVFPGSTRISKNDTEMKIRLRYGSLWQLVGSDYYDSIVGANPVGLVMSEAALSDPTGMELLPAHAGRQRWLGCVLLDPAWLQLVLRPAAATPRPT